MSCDYSKYPKDWFTRIRPDILKRAGNKCEKCGLPNKAFGIRDENGTFYYWEYIEARLENDGYDLFEHELVKCIDKNGLYKGLVKIVLTISHQDHDITNNDYSNLKALCSRCHFLHDVSHHKATRKRNKGLQELF